MLVLHSQEFVKNDSKEFKIDFIIEIELLWEVLLAQLRNLLMTYAAKKRKEKEKESKLTYEISEMEKDIGQQIGNENWTQILRNNKQS